MSRPGDGDGWLLGRARYYLRTVWSLGRVASPVLTGLAHPTGNAAAASIQLRPLLAGGLLVRQRMRAPTRGERCHLYSLGPAAATVDPAWADPWRPPMAQLGHTLAVGRTLLRLFRAPPDGLVCTGWAGEAELRGWCAGADPVPDAELRYLPAGSPGLTATGPPGAPPGEIVGGERVVWLEVDLGTESRAVWRRKLARYRSARTGPDAVTGLVLATTTHRARARAIAQLATRLEVPLAALPTAELLAAGSTGSADCYHSLLRRRCPLGTVLC